MNIGELKDDIRTTLINLNQFKVFNGADYHFVEEVLPTDRFQLKNATGETLWYKH